MATVPEFISVLRKIRDVIYPSINETYQESLVLKQSIDTNKAEFDTDFEEFSTEYDDFIIKKGQVDTSVASASNSALSASQSATIATNKSNEIKAIKTQSTTGAAGTNASVSYNPIDGKFTFVIPQGVKGDKGESFTVDSSGITANRTLYDNKLAKWSFLDLTTSTLYFKLSNISGDWSTGIPFGKGDKGDDGEAGVGIGSFAFLSTTDSSGLAGKSGATDTYRVTLTNSNTFNYIVYNGLDFTAINSLVKKTTTDNADEFIFGDSTSNFSLKKISWTNIVDKLKTLFNIDSNGNIGTGIQTFNGFGGAGFKNYIINGKKTINQRALTSTNNSYNQDKWYKIDNNWFQAIESDNNLISGKIYSLSWVGSATASYYVGTATSSTINAQTFTSISNGGNFTLSISAGKNLWIKFASDATGSNFNFVQLEEGSVATPFEQRPYGLELNLCQRYYEIISGSYGVAIQYTANGDTRINIPFKVTKSAMPKVSVSGNWNVLAVGHASAAVNALITPTGAIPEYDINGIYAVTFNTNSNIQACGTNVCMSGHSNSLIFIIESEL